MKQQSKYSVLLVIIAIGFVAIKLYYIYVANLQGAFAYKIMSNNGDASHYLQIAKNIANFKVYSDTNSEIISETATWRPPFWPFILSVFFYFTSNPLGLIIIKAVVETFLILYSLSIVVRNSVCSWLSIGPFLMLFIEPQYLKYAVTFLSESFTSVLLLVLTVLFVHKATNKKSQFVFPIVAGAVVLCHPVSVFFVAILFAVYIRIIAKANLKNAFFQIILFSSLIVLWPIRNELTFNKGFYLTASQGATFSKGWNENVIHDFSNVDGDLADESLNLKLVDKNEIAKADKSVLSLSKLYQKATLKFIKNCSIEERIHIVFKKIKSNLNPFPERPKPGLLETISIFFRILYLICLAQTMYKIIHKPKIDLDTLNGRVYIVVLAIFIGQICMATYIYTGLRFNAIYALALLFCSITINKKRVEAVFNSNFLQKSK